MLQYKSIKITLKKTYKVKERKRKDKCRQVHGHHLWILQQDLILVIFVSIGWSVGHSIVKVMVTILIHLGWGKPLKHKIWWVDIGSGSVRMPKYLLWGGKFYNGWCNAVDQGMLWESLMIYKNFCDIRAASDINVVSVVSIHQQTWTPSDLLWMSWCFPGGECSQLSHLCMDTGIKKALFHLTGFASYQPRPLSCSTPSCCLGCLVPFLHY